MQGTEENPRIKEEGSDPQPASFVEASLTLTERGRMTPFEDLVQRAQVQIFDSMRMATASIHNFYQSLLANDI